MGYGTSTSSSCSRLELIFQYPLRAYGLWNVGGDQVGAPLGDLSVPSAGLWAMELSNALTELGYKPTFSTLCGPMGYGTHSFSTS